MSSAIATSIVSSFQRMRLLCVLFLVAACELTPEGGSLFHASAELGNTYAISAPRQVYACDASMANCFRRDTGNFTIDNAVVQIESHIVSIHLVFEDGRSGWMRHNAFLGQKFSEPVKTSRVVKPGMTTEQIKSMWGEPANISPQPFGSVILQRWSYPTIGTLYLEDGKLADFRLRKSLLAAD